MTYSVTLHGPIGELARQLSPVDHRRAEEIYAATLGLWSAVIAPTVKVSTRLGLRPVLVWTMFVGGPMNLRRSAARLLNSEETFTNLNAHPEISTYRQLVQAALHDRKISTAAYTPGTLLTGNPFVPTPNPSGRWLRDELDFALRKAWDGSEFLRHSDQQRHVPPMVGVLWEVPAPDWEKGERNLSDNLYTRTLPFKICDTSPLAPLQHDQQRSQLAEAYTWATSKSHRLQLDDAAGDKWYPIRRGRGLLEELLSGHRSDVFCTRLGEHTLRVAAALAAAEKSTAIREEKLEAAWSLVRRSIKDAFDLTPGIKGPIEEIIADIDSSVSAVSGANRTDAVAHVPSLTSSDSSTDLDLAPATETPDVPARRRQALVQSLARDSGLKRQVKQWYQDVCQMCRTVLRIPSPAGTYSEAAHIQALGAPHGGPDRIENLLCLCPNCHILFDNGARYLTDDLRIVDAIDGREVGTLAVHPHHRIGTAYVRKHRSRWASPTSKVPE